MNAPDRLPTLEEPFANLRQRWPQGWPGLPLVLSRCLQQLGHAEGAKLPAATQRLQACLWDVAELAEADGRQRAERGAEPAYHNRLHVADTLVALTLLLLALRDWQSQAATQKTTAKTTVKTKAKSTTPPPSHSEWLALLAMLSHDLMHDGRVNRLPSEMETLSVKALLPVMRRHRVAAADQAAVQHIILMTDPTQVANCHLKMAGRTFSTDELDALVILVEEADIWVSSLPHLGLQLTRQLAVEWTSSAPERARAVIQPEGRLGFLRFAALFTSPAALQLGIRQVRQAQIDALEASL